MRMLIVGGALAALTAAACGQKGPLYLPQEPREVVTRPATPAEPPPPAESQAPEEPEDDESTDPPR